jgi:hypothetical protein
MSVQIDFRPLTRVLGRFWEQHQNLPQIRTFWEGLLRASNDQWLQLGQVKSSRFLASVPTYIFHENLYRRVENWEDTGVFHRHYKVTFRATANQKIFYPGLFLEGESARVYIEGKQLDAQGGDFLVTDEQDSTQPGTNPRGSRVILTMPVPAGASVQVFVQRETFWTDHTFTAPQTSFAFARYTNPLSVQIIIDSLDITGETQIDGAGTTLSYAPSSATSPTTEDTRRFLTGEVIRIVDGTLIQRIVVTQDAAQLTIPTAVSPASSVFREINVDVSPGKVHLETNRLYLEGQSFPPNTRVRVMDGENVQTFDITALTDVIDLEKTVNPETARVTYMSGSIYEGVEVTTNGLTLGRSYQVGVRLFIKGAFHEDHDHASYHVELDTASDRASVPRTRPWVIDPGGSELPDFPLEVHVDGMLQHPDQYILLPGEESFTVRFMNGASPNYLPAGTKIDFFYVDEEDNRLHRHVNDRYETADGQIAFALSAPHSERYPLRLSVDGVLQNDPDNYAYTPLRDFVHVDPAITGGSIVKVWGERLELPYQAWVDTDIEEGDFVELDMPVSRVVGAQYLQNGIDPSEDTGILQLPRQTTVDAPEVGFSITPDPNTTSAFLLMSSSIFEDSWLAGGLVDERTAWRNFGSILDIRRESGDQYSRVLQALFAAYYRGSQGYTLENFVCLIMGASFLDLQGRLVRAVSTTDRRYAVVEDKEGEKEYDLSQVVPDRFRPTKGMPRLHALTAYARDLELTEENFPWLPVIAEDFAVDFSFAKRLDIKTNATISGVDPTYDPRTEEFVDETKNFVDGDEGEVWRNDLVTVLWTDGSRSFGRVQEIVDKTILRVTLQVPVGGLGWGGGGWGGAPPGTVHGWGGIYSPADIASYEIAVRKTRRLDTHRFLDQLDSEDFSYVSGVLLPIFRPFTILMRFHWEGLQEGFLTDVKKFLDTAKPASSRYIAFTQVNEDEGISDEVTFEFEEDDAEIEMIPNIWAIGLGALNAGNPIGASIEVAT